MALSLKSLLQQRAAALKILAAFRDWKARQSAFTWSSVFMKDSKGESIFPRIASIVKKKQVSNRSLQLATESYKYMVDNPDTESAYFEFLRIDLDFFSTF